MSAGPVSDLTRRLTRNFFWLSVQEGMLRIIGLITAIYLARTLSPANYGSLGLALAVVGVVMVLVRAGSGSRATRLTARDPEAVPDIYAEITGLRIVAAAIGIIGLIAFSPWIARALSIPPTLLIVSTLLLVRPALTVVWAFRGLDRMDVTTAAKVADKVLALAGLLLLVRGSGDDYLWAPVVEAAAGLVMMVWVYRQLLRIYPHVRIEFRVRDWPEVSREALPLGLAALMGSLYLNGVVLLLGWFANPESAAAFLVAQKVMLTLALLLQVINRSAFPSASRLLLADMPGTLALTARLLRYYLVMVIPAILLVAFHADVVLQVLFGSAYADAGPVLLVMMGAVPFMAINQSLRLLLMALPRPMSVFATDLVSTSVMLSLCAVLIPRTGAVGAAAALVVTELAAMILLSVFVRRATGGLPWNTRCLAAFAAGAVAALVYAAAAAWTPAGRLAIAGLVYLVAALVLRAVTTSELRALPRVASSLLERRQSADDGRQDSGVEPGSEKNGEE